MQAIRILAMLKTDPSNMSRWKEKFPTSTYPVLAMTGTLCRLGM